MIRVGGRTLLERTVDSLQIAGIHKFVIVVGWEHEKLIQFIQENITDMEFEFVYIMTMKLRIILRVYPKIIGVVVY